MTDAAMMEWEIRWEAHFFAERYWYWRNAFYSERSRWMEGARFAILADSDAEAIDLLLRAEDSNG